MYLFILNIINLITINNVTKCLMPRVRVYLLNVINLGLLRGKLARRLGQYIISGNRGELGKFSEYLYGKSVSKLLLLRPEGTIIIIITIRISDYIQSRTSHNKYCTIIIIIIWYCDNNNRPVTHARLYLVNNTYL